MSKTVYSINVFITAQKIHISEPTKATLEHVGGYRIAVRGEITMKVNI